MSDVRAAKSGVALDNQRKMLNKYDPDIAQQILCWINEKTGSELCTDGNMENFRAVLIDGTVMCKLLNCLAGTEVVKKIKPSTMTFKRIEMISLFVNNAKSHFGVPAMEAFEPVDLVDTPGNPSQVLLCLDSLKRKVGEGIKEAKSNKREFTEEQRRAGASVIGLQMGTNKGASQKGMNFGNTRHIVD